MRPLNKERLEPDSQSKVEEEGEKVEFEIVERYRHLEEVAEIETKS